MEKINQEFNIPYYIFEEITEYIELNESKYYKKEKWENIKALLKLAVDNKRITKEQHDFILEKYNRE